MDDRPTATIGKTGDPLPWWCPPERTFVIHATGAAMTYSPDGKWTRIEAQALRDMEGLFDAGLVTVPEAREMLGLGEQFVGVVPLPPDDPGVSLLHQPDGSWVALGGYAQFAQEAPSWSGPGPDPDTTLVAETTHFRVPRHKPRSRTVGYLCMGCHGTWVDEDGAGRCPHCTARAHGSEQYQIAARAADERRAEQTSEVRRAELGRELWSERKRRLVERIAATASEVDTRNERERAEADAEQAALKARAMFGDRYGFRTSADHDGEAAARRLAHRNAATPCRHAVTDNVTTSLGRVLLCCDCGMHIDGNPGDARAK